MGPDYQDLFFQEKQSSAGYSIITQRVLGSICDRKMPSVFFDSACFNLLLHDIFRSISFLATLDTSLKAFAFSQEPFYNHIFSIDLCFIKGVMACLIRNGRISPSAYEGFDSFEMTN